MDSCGENLDQILVIRSGGLTESFVVRFSLSIECFDPDLSPGINFRRMLAGPAGVAYRLADDGTPAVTREQEVARDALGDSPPPHEASFASTDEDIGLFVSTLLDEIPDVIDIFPRETAHRRARKSANQGPTEEEKDLLFHWKSEETKAVSFFLSQLPLLPNAKAGARLVAQVRRARAQKELVGARTITTRWSEFIAGQRISARKARQLEHDLRDVVMGYGTLRQMETIDARVLFIYMQDGPMLFAADPTRHDYRMPVKLRQPGLDGRLRDIALKRSRAREALEGGTLTLGTSPQRAVSSPQGGRDGIVGSIAPLPEGAPLGKGVFRAPV